MPAWRYDLSEFRKPQRTREGWLRADAVLTRTGVFAYQKPDGSVQQELRLPDEVFHADALGSFSLAPLTREHPSQPVTAETWKQVAVGTIGEEVKRDGDMVRAAILITDAQAVRDAESGTRRQLSCGYTCDLDFTPGLWNGLHYDAVQKNIRGNHVALVKKGRAGPDAAVRMDAADAYEVGGSATDDTDTEPPKRKPRRKDAEGDAAMVKIRIDGVEYEVPEQAAQAVQKVEAQRKDVEAKLAEEAKASKAAHEKEKGRADALAEEVKKAKDAQAPEKLAELVAARVALQSTAQAILGASAKLDGLSDKDIKVQVIQKHSAAFHADGLSDDHIDGRFQAVVEVLQGKAPTSVQATRAAALIAGHQDTEDPLAAAQKKFREDNQKAWQQPVAQGAKA